MSYKNNYTEDWDGQTGSAVAKTIQDALSEHGTALNSHETKINDNIKDILFDVDSNTSTVTCTITKSDDTTVEGTTTNKHKFTLLAVSNNEATLNIADITTLGENNTILKYGNSFSFDYDWEVRTASQSKRSGATGNLMVTVVDASGNSNTYNKGSVPVTKTGTNTIKTVTLNASELPEGTNTILVLVVGSYSGASIYSNTAEFKLNVLNPKLTVTFDENNGINILRNLSDKLNWNFAVTNSKGNALQINGTTVSVVTKNFYYGSTLATNTTDNTVNWSIDDIRGSISALTGRLKIYILAAITMNGTTVLSNIVMIYFMGNNSNATDYTWYAIQLNDVISVASGAPTIKANLYDTITFNINVLSQVANNLTYSLTKDGNTTLLTTKDISANTLTDISYSYIFKNTGTQTFKIVDLNSHSLDILISVASLGASIGELTSQIISLSASGKTLSDHTWKYGDYNVEFDSNFDWSGNGWENNGLLLNNGATATLNYCPFSTGVFTASFKINASNSIESETLVSCKSGNTGFEILPEKATFQINGTGISTEFNSTETHEITFVRYGSSYGNLIMIYIDGQAQLSKTVADDASSLTCPIIMTSTNTQCYIYNVNIFSSALSFTNVLAIYCFNQTNSTEIVNYIKDNDVFDEGATMTTIGYKDGQAITPESLPVGARYLIISEYCDASATTDATKCLDPKPWLTIDEYPGAEAEKYKGIYHLVGNVKLIEKVANGEAPSARNFLVDKATLAAQGTSSMAYPMKNFRLAFKKPIDSTCPYYNSSKISDKAGDFGYSMYMYVGVSESDYIETTGTATNYTAEYKGTTGKAYSSKNNGKLGKLKYPIRSKDNFGGEDDVNSAEANIFCLKADYAESSGSHNTGFARLVNDALTNSTNICETRETNSILPLLYVVNSKGNDANYKKEIRSTIDGYPVYLFFKTTDGTIIFHGKYNFNNEKSSKDVFGFEKISDYYDNSIVKNESAVLKKLFNDTNNYYDATHFTYTIDDSGEYDDGEDYINPTECWEFSNNTFDIEPTDLNVIGAFNFPYTDTASTDGIAYPKTSTYPNKNPFTVKDGEGELAWLSQAWEYRYPGLDDDSAGDLAYKNGYCKPFLLDSLYKWLYKHNGTLINFDSQIINDFAENLHKYFNVNYLLKYFVLTKWFGNVDLRVKNCMLSFYCDPTVTLNDDADSPMGHMRAFYIFYDNDTILGIDNAGTLTLNWDIDEDVYPSYGKHAIWDNLEYCYNYYVSGKTEFLAILELGELILSAYLSVRKVITNDKLTKYFETDLVNKFPDAIHNLDPEVKYYFVGNLNSTVSNFASALIAKFLGNRRFHRNRWLSKRTNWLDAKFKAGNIDLYSYLFKVGGTSGTSLPGGTIKLTSAIKNWRFHITDSTSKLKISSPLLAVDASYNMPITANSFSISDFVLIEALYGCSEIDFTNFETSTWFLDLNNGGNALPYMKVFTLNDASNSDKPKKFSSSAFEKLLTMTSNGGEKTTIFPNLEELNICYTLILSGNGEASTRLPALDLSSFSKLAKINFTGTAVDVTLPNSSLLTSLILASPISLNITNKPNITKLSIGTDELTTLIAGAGNNSYVYDWILNTTKSKYSTTEFKSTITMGTKENYYHITTALIESLVTLAEANPSNVTIKGYLYNADISNENVDLLTTVFKELTISTSTSSSIEFRLSDTALKEGSSLTINLSSGLLESADNWYWAIYDDSTKTFVRNNSLNGLITEDSTNKTRTKLVLNAALSGTNNNVTYRLKVGAYYDDLDNPTFYENEISILYVAVTKVTLNADKNILDKGLNTLLTLSCTPSTHTKTLWIKDNADWPSTLGGSVDSSTLVFTKDNSENDASVKLTVGGITSNTLTIYYDKLLSTYTSTSEESVNNNLHWIYNLMYAAYGTGASLQDPIKVSHLNAISLTSFTLSNLAYTYNDGSGNTTIVPLDLTYLQYCKYTDPLFTIPSSLEFTDIVIPSVKVLTSVIWNPNVDYYNYGKVIFPEYLETALITINNDNHKFNNLLLDFSKTKITKIYNGNGSCESMAASVSFTYNNSQVSESPTNSIFSYPTTLTTLGNYVDLNNWTTNYLAIFNLNGTSTAEFAPLYLIAACSTLKKLGPLYNYKVSNSIVSSGTAFPQTSTNLTHLYHAFQNGNLPNGNTELQDFSNLIQIGTSSFYGISIDNLNLGSNITDIGALAFMLFTGAIKTSDSTDLPESITDTVLVFPNVKTIGDYAFAQLTTAIKFEFNNLTQIGDYAFARKSGDSFTHTIYINQTTPFEYTANSFGSGNTIYMPETLQTQLAKSSELWSALNNNVTIKTL